MSFCFFSLSEDEDQMMRSEGQQVSWCVRWRQKHRDKMETWWDVPLLSCRDSLNNICNFRVHCLGLPSENILSSFSPFLRLFFRHKIVSFLCSAWVCLCVHMMDNWIKKKRLNDRKSSNKRVFAPRRSTTRRPSWSGLYLRFLCQINWFKFDSFGFNSAKEGDCRCDHRVDPQVNRK